MSKTSVLIGVSMIVAAAVGNANAQDMVGKMIAHGDLGWAPMAPESPVMAVTL